ncbi:hypothetical protein SUGI_0478420 [Cryptomeria japonica]|nr:hypothetical protein SUGI_0478420 [Cryptomeria japonica]
MLESPAPSEVPPGEGTWYGNIQYLLNISAIGAVCCLLLFLCVKLRSDHKLPGLSSLATKLLAVWHTTGQQIARTCGANPAQFLYVEGGSFVALAVICFLAICGILPLNLYGGTVAMEDQFSKTTISHIEKGSPLLWMHVLFMVIVVCVVHFCIKALEERLNMTRFHDGNFSIDSVSVYTLMIQGIPKTLSIDKRAIQEYFEHRYPGKVYRVVVPPDLASLDDLAQELVKVRDDIAWLQARIDGREISEERDIFLYFYEQDEAAYNDLSVEERHHGSCFARLKYEWRQFVIILKRFKEWAAFHLGFTDEERLRKLEAHRAELESNLAVFKDGRAQGAGVAFVIFKDIYTANKALQDARTEKKRPRIGKFVSIMELQLEKSRWKVERAPPAADIYWRHLGTSKISRKIRRVIVNASLLVLLLFFSSPLAIITALQSAGRIIDAEAMDNAASWLAWVQSSSWAAALIFQFLPNVLIFVSMYIVIPAALSSLSKIESHLTVSGEHQAVFVKTFCFFLVNLIFLRVLVESSLEGALLRMGQCYMDGNDCKKIEEYMSASFLTRSCLSSLAFLITSTFLGISFDLLAPIPWIKKKLRKFGKNGLLQSTHEETEVYAAESQEDNLEASLLSQSYFSFDDEDTGSTQRDGVNGLDLQGGDLSVYPINKTDHHPMIQTFDFAQYYAFNLTIFALTLIYSAFAPLVLPVGACYFGYRYVVDKYNFLFVYRVHGLPAGNDGKLMTTVLRIMRLCVILFLLSMLFFFSVRGDSGKLQFLCTFVTIIFYCFKCGFDKLISSTKTSFPPHILEGVRTIDSIVDGPTEYEVYAQPKYDWDVSSI